MELLVPEDLRHLLFRQCGHILGQLAYSKNLFACFEGECINFFFFSFFFSFFLRVCRM
jgi:hypothetical protein